MDRRKTRFSIVTPVEHTEVTHSDASSSEDEFTEVCKQANNTTSMNKNQNNEISPSKIMDSFAIICLDMDADSSTKDIKKLMKQLRSIFNTTKKFINADECVDYLTDLTQTKAFLVIHNYPDNDFLSTIHELYQLQSIYIFSTVKEKHEQCIEDFKLVKSTYTDVEDICTAIEQDIKKFLINLTPFSIIPPSSSLNLDELDQSFMYTQLLKEIIMDFEYDAKKEMEDFIQYCLNHTVPDTRSETLNKFRQYYGNHSPIWWYTKEGFVYLLLNRALRTQEVEIIIKMGFFIQDLHQEIQHKYSKIKHLSKIIVYRGQGLSQADFEKLQKSKGGLISFNNFLSTSTDRAISNMFAESISHTYNMIGILFQMEIDPTLSSTPFISLDGISGFESEAEILFSMHTVFRIGDLIQIDNRLWEVRLTLTRDDDPQLKSITNFMRREISVGNPWIRMVLLMVKMGRFDEAFEISDAVIQTINDDDSKTLEVVQSILWNMTGTISLHKGEYSKALRSYERFLELSKDFFSENHPIIFKIHSNIALTYNKLGDFSKALLYLRKTEEIHQRYSLADDAIIAETYHSLALVYHSLGDYPVALSYSVKTLEIQQNLMPTGYPDLAITLNNLAMIHFSMGQYSTAHSYFQKVLESELKYLPPDHPTIGATYSNVGMVFTKMVDYSNALCCYQKAIEILQRSLPSNHPNIGEIYNSISMVHYAMRNYSSALFYGKQALENLRKALPTNHPTLAGVHMNIGLIYHSTGESSTALIHFKETLEIYQKSLPLDHPDFAIVYNNMGAIHQSLGEYSVALSYYQKTLKIQQKTLPPDHPDLARTYSNISSISLLNQDWTSLVSSTEKQVETHQKHFQSGQSIRVNNLSDANEMCKNYSEFSSSLKKLGNVWLKPPSSINSDAEINGDTVDEVRKFAENWPGFISSVEKALMSHKKCPSSTSPFFNGFLIDRNDETAQIDNALSALTHFKEAFNAQKLSSLLSGQEVDINGETDNEEPFSIDRCSLAIDSLVKVFELQQKYLPPNDVSLATYYNMFGEQHCLLEAYSNALPLFEKALENLQTRTPVNQQLLAKTYNNIGTALASLGRGNEAMDCVKQAFEIARSALGSNHSETETYRNHFRQLRSMF